MCHRHRAAADARGEHFELAGRTWAMPGYDDIDDLLAAFDDAGLLAHDEVIEAALRGGEPLRLAPHRRAALHPDHRQ